MGQRLNVCGKLKAVAVGVAKASVNSANKSHVLDPKPSDLAMVRLKVG